MASPVIDAVICPFGFPDEGETGEDKHYARNRIFGPPLGSARVRSREIPGVGGNFVLVTREDDLTTLLFPTGHPRHPEHRHEWREAVWDAVNSRYVRGDAVVTPGGFAAGKVYMGVMKD